LIGISQISYGDGDYRSGLEASQQAVSIYRQLGDSFGLGFALCHQGNMAAFQGDIDLAESSLNEAIRVGRMYGNKLILAYATGVLSQAVYLPRGNISQARAVAEESARYSREIGLPWSVAQTELILATAAAIEGKWDEARAYSLSVTAVAQEMHDPHLLNLARYQLGDIELRAGNLLEAQRLHHQAILVWQELGQIALIIHELESFAYMAREQNQPLRVAFLLGAAEAVQESIRISAIGVMRLQDEYQRTVAWLHTQLDESAFASHWSDGGAMSMDQAISYALRE
jgi:tetratricopeptide (TPR) repeat protein